MEAMQFVARSPEERLERRRVRRWKRRARIVGPFVGIPILLAALSLSVDLVEYQPSPDESEPGIDRPMQFAELDDAARLAARDSLRTTSLVSHRSIIPRLDPVIEMDLKALDLMLPPEYATPTPPHALR